MRSLFIGLSPRAAVLRACLTAAALLGLAVLSLPALAGALAERHDGASFTDARTDAARGTAQQPLREAYRLADTWSERRQGAPGSLLFPGGVDLADGELYVVDAGNERISVFDVKGSFQRTWGRRGEAPEELGAPRDVAVDGDRVYVADPGRGDLAVYDREGGFVERWSADGLDAPWGLAASGGRVWVSQPESGDVFVLEAGTEVARWTGLATPRGLTVDAAGQVHVAQEGAVAVTRHDPADGRELDRLDVAEPPLDLGVDRNGDRYVQSADAIHWYEEGQGRSKLALYYRGYQGIALSANHGVFATVVREEAPSFQGILKYPWQPRETSQPDPWRLLGYPLGRFERPSAIDRGPDGRIWIADAWPRAQAFSPQGLPVEQRQLCAPERSECEPTVDLAAASDGFLYAVEHGRLKRIAPDGVLTATLQFRLRGRGWATGLALSGDERLARVMDGAEMRLRELGITSTLRVAGATELAAPGDDWRLLWDVAESPDDPERVYVSNRSEGTLDVYERGARVERWQIEGIPSRVDVAQDGSVFVLTGEGIVWKHAAGGEVLAGWDTSAFSATGAEVVDLAAGADGRVYTVDRAANLVRVWEPDPEGDLSPPVARAGACRLRGDKRAAPETLKLGGQVTVTLEVGGECPNTAPRADIVLAVDRSGSMMQDGGITATREAAITFLDAIDLREDRIAVVQFNNTAQLLQELTDDVAAARNAIAGLSAIGGTNLDLPLRLADQELFGPRGRADAKPVIVLLTDGRPSGEPTEGLDAAAEAKRRGARIFTIGFGDIDPMMMTLMASSPEDAYLAADPSTLTEIYAEIATRITASSLARSLEIRDELPNNMRFVGAIEGPAPDLVGRELRWSLTDLPFSGLRLRYTLEPRELGRHPTNVEAVADFVDGVAQPGSLRFPVPRVEVIDLDPTPTPTPTRFPTATPTPLPPEPIFLPLALRQSCEDEAIATDVAVVMDNSGSMAAETRPGGPSQLVAAIDAAELLLAQLRPGDRATIVAFHEEAVLVQSLTEDRALLLERLRGITTESGTRIDRGLALALDELTGPRGEDGNTRAVVLLTDGRSSVEDDVVLATADEVKDAVARLFVIGLGDEEAVDRQLLARVASRPEDFFAAPSADELSAIYEQIAKVIECANLAWP